MKTLTIALAKGRTAKQVMKMLNKIGITCNEMNDPDTRKLIFENNDLGLRFILVKPSDVPTYVERGVADMGVAGKDILLEEGRALYEVLDLETARCKICVCGPAEAAEKLRHGEQITVATKFPNITKNYFYNEKYQTVEIIHLNGSVELAPLVGLSDVIVDIVETGSTLKDNGLVVLEEICPISARLVVNQVSMKISYDRIMKLVRELRKVVKEP